MTPTLSPATHSAIPSMLPCCTSDLKRRNINLRLYKRLQALDLIVKDLNNDINTQREMRWAIESKQNDINDLRNEGLI